MNFKFYIKKIFLIKPKNNIFCSMAFNYHDSSVSFAIDNKIVLVLEAERIFRTKKKVCNIEEMEFLVKHGLNLLNKKIEDIRYWSMTTFNNPFLTEEDIIDKKTAKIRDPYWKSVSFFGLEKEVFITNHHLSHAGIYLSTGYKNSIIVSCDGGGDIDPVTHNNECLAIFTGKENKIIKQNIATNDFITGKTYGICSTFLYGNDIHSKTPSEGKFMALAGYGKLRTEYYQFLEKNYLDIEKADYKDVLNILEKSELKYLHGKALEKTDDAKDFASTVHKFFIDKRLQNLEYIMKKIYSNEEALILSGGASLNLDFNTKVLEKYPDLKHFVAPCCDDTGQSLGSLCILIVEILKKRPLINLPYLGDGNEKYLYKIEPINKIVDILLKNGIVILHNGKSEIGPRALGNRSFIIRADNLELKSKLSEKIKQRESYRPLAPIIIEEKLKNYFIGPSKSPFMLYRYEVIENMKEKIIASVHIDNSARVQTVNKKENSFLYDLIKKFGDKTGTYVLLNTSLNLKGEPLTNKIEESINIYNKITGPKCIVYNGSIIKME